MELLVTIALFATSVGLNAWFTWQMFRVHRERHDKTEDMALDCFSALADRVEAIEDELRRSEEKR